MKKKKEREREKRKREKKAKMSMNKKLKKSFWFWSQWELTKERTRDVGLQNELDVSFCCVGCVSMVQRLGDQISFRVNQFTD